MLKKMLIGIGMGVLVIIAGFIALAGWVVHERSAYATTAVPYIKTVIPKLTSWDVEQVKPTMDPDVLKTMQPDKLNEVLAWLSGLGHLKSMDEPVFVNVWSGASTRSGTITLVTYMVHAHFDAGDGDITIRVRDDGGRYSVYLFNINSEALIKRPIKA